MKNLLRTLTTAAALNLGLGLHVPALAQAEDPSGYGDGYQAGDYGRVRAADGGVTIVRADAETGAPDNAGVNAPIFPGDTVRTDGSQRVEVQFVGGTLVRIDRGSEVVFQSMPNPSAKYRDNTVLALNAGSVRIASRLGEQDEFRIDTRAASVYLLGEGDFRIESDDRGVTQLASLRGVAEVVGNDASVLVRGGMRTAAVAGSAPDNPRAYTTFTSDGFDRWCEARDDSYRAQARSSADDEQPENVPEEVRPYEAELSHHGTWAVDATYGEVWYPSGVATGWRPYVDGYWSYGPGGYFWVSYEPWGWAPYHYGSWQWTAYRGWCWVPGRVFAGAWVSWSWGAAYVGWAPLDYWGRPGWIGGPYYAGYYDPGCWTFVGYNHIASRHVNHHAVAIDTVRGDFGRATVVSRAPSVDPRRIAQSPAWRDRAIREVAGDRSAHMSPSRTDRVPERSLADVQNQLMRRPVQAPSATRATRDASAAGSVERRTIAPKSRRILADPRVGSPSSVRPGTRDDVRELYQRMSRPRETRGQDETAPRATTPSYETQQSRPEASRGGSSPKAHAPREVPSAHGPRSSPSSPDGPRAEAPRAKSAPAEAPRAHAPTGQAPRAQAPRSQAPAPRGQSPRPSGGGQAKSDKRGGKK